MSTVRCTLTGLTSFKKKQFISFFGGVLLALLLALIPHSSYAAEQDFYQDSDYTRWASKSAIYGLGFGCNITPLGDNQYTDVYAGTDNTLDNATSPCSWGYNDGSIVNRGEGYFGASLSYVNNDLTNQNLTQHFSEFLPSLSQSSYIDMGYRTAVRSFSYPAMRNEQNTDDISFSNLNDDSYSLFVSGFMVSDSMTVSAWIPTIPCSVFNKNGSQLTIEQCSRLQRDIYGSTTIVGYYKAKELIPNEVWSNILLNYDITNDDDNFVKNHLWFLIAYIPHSDDWTSFNEIKFNYNNQDLSKNNLVVSSSIISSWWADGAFYSSPYNLSSSTIPSPTRYYINSISGSYWSIYQCRSSSCRSSLNAYKNNAVNSHDNNIANQSYISQDNPAQSWFGNIFNFSILFPFHSFFASFTDNRCVDIPIIAGLLGTSQNRYCTWWSNDIRNITTPVISTISMMILFGFVVSWLKGNSFSLFRSEQTGYITKGLK